MSIDCDLLIRNGTLYDGSGGPPFRGDLAVNGQTIAAIGPLTAVRGRVELDADGLAALGERAAASSEHFARSTVRLLAPVPDPEKIICLGLNYRDHAAEAHQDIPEHPMWFGKFANSLAGDGADVLLPAAHGAFVDYEAELAVVIGRPAKDVDVADALSFVAGAMPTIRNVTVTGNEFGIASYAGGNPDISNCILWDNIDGDLFGCTATYSCVQQGVEGEGNIREDPLFADPEAGDYHLLSERGRFVPAHALWAFDTRTSPCVDTGDPKLDPGAERMPNGGRINMGAFGGTPQASMSEWPLAGDLNRDRRVDFADLAILLDQWLEELPAVSAVEPESLVPSAVEPESSLPGESEPGSEQPLSS